MGILEGLGEVRFWSFATELVKADPHTCPLLLQ